MLGSEKKNFVAMMNAVGELYSKNISGPLLEIYWRSLSQFEYSEVEQAVQKYINHADNGQFIPKPADIVKMISGSGEDRALAAWAKVLQAIQRVGVYGSVVFDDAVIHVAITEMGGWVRLCSSKQSELGFFEREFLKIYQLQLRQPAKHYPAQLTGLLSHPEKPVLIGDQNKAQWVLENGTGYVRSSRQTLPQKTAQLAIERLRQCKTPRQTNTETHTETKMKI